MSAATGMDGARVQLPSGKYTDEVVDLRQAAFSDVAYVVARFMFSHAIDGQFQGSVGTAMRAVWVGQDHEEFRKRIPRVLRLHGFQPHQDTATGRFFWIVPATFPAWTDVRSKFDDGSQTTGGPVTVRQIEKVRWTDKAVALVREIERTPGLHPWQYGERLGWKRQQVSHVGVELRNTGYIFTQGDRASARYFRTTKPLPDRVKAKKHYPTPVAKDTTPEPAPVKPVELPATPPPKPEPKPVLKAVPDRPRIVHLPEGFYVIDGGITRVDVEEFGE